MRHQQQQQQQQNDSKLSLPSIHSILSSIDTPASQNVNVNVISAAPTSNVSPPSSVRLDDDPDDPRHALHYHALPALSTPLDQSLHHQMQLQIQQQQQQHAQLQLQLQYQVQQQHTQLQTPTPPAPPIQVAPRCTCKSSPTSSQHIPRPRNAFILFRQHLHNHLYNEKKKLVISQGSFKTNSLVSREIGQRWRSLSETDKKHWQTLAEREKILHKLNHPDYKYLPRKSVKGEFKGFVEQTIRKETCDYCRAKRKR